MAALLALAAFAAPAAAADRRLSVTDFDRVIVEGPYQRPSRRRPPVRGDGERQRARRSTGSPSTSRARPCASAATARPGAARRAPMPGRSTIELTTRRLRSARLVGPAQLERARAQPGSTSNSRVEGSGTLRAAGVDADNLSLGLLGSGRLEIGGSAGALRGDFQGTGTVDARTSSRRTRPSPPPRSGDVAARPCDGPVTVTNNGLGEVSVLGRAGLHDPAASSAAQVRLRTQISASTASLPARSGGSASRSVLALAEIGRRIRRLPDSASPGGPRFARRAHRHQFGIEPDDRLAGPTRARRSRRWSGARRSAA